MIEVASFRESPPLRHQQMTSSRPPIYLKRYDDPKNYENPFGKALDHFCDKITKKTSHFRSFTDFFELIT